MPGNPLPRVQWRKADGHLPPDHQVVDGILRINRVQARDAGEYICNGRSAVGSQDISAVLIVKGKNEFWARNKLLFQVHCMFEYLLNFGCVICFKYMVLK